MAERKRAVSIRSVSVFIGLLPLIFAACLFYVLLIFVSPTGALNSSALAYFGLAMAGILAFGVSAAILRHRRFGIPVRKLVENTRNITIYTRLPGTSRSGFREITDNLNGMFARVSYLMDEITGITGNLVESLNSMSDTSLVFSQNAQNQAATTEQITATIEEISAGMETVTNNVSMQFSKLSELTRNILTLSSVITEISRQVQDAQALSGEISHHVAVGSETLERLSVSMETIRANSREMTNIVQIINDISDKINLLSLNASIEAARAGDYGRGFAVVADEISKLADQTTMSIKDIDALIKKNDQEIVVELGNVKETVSMISGISQGVGRIDSLVDQISSNVNMQLEIKEIINREADTVKSGSDEIKASTEEQHTAIQEIVKSVSQINESTQAIASGSEQIANKSVELASTSQVLKERIEYVKL
ncbi:MAG: hypothetical protein EPN93_02665 [Spirochaetes bacterium]|nr:MAG: hypothetical protein EPN93_02665 [Spirochaetota bacterium]